MPKDRTDTPALPRPRMTITPAKPGYPRDGGDLDLLVNLGVDLPEVSVDRKPLSLALVIDRSGSMNGRPLESAKAAACAAIEMLLPDDWVSVVTFDTEVGVFVPLRQVGHDRAGMLTLVRGIVSGGSTALYAGWAEGLSQAMASPIGESTARVVLLSDGQANVGVVDAPSIAADVARATMHGVTTTAMGFGQHYDEALLRSMADAGQGNYVFIEGDSQIVEAFQHELAGLSTLRGRRVTLEASSGVTLSPLGVHAMALAAAGNGPGTAAGSLRLPDLVAGLDREQVVRARFAPGAVAPTLTLAWDDLLTGATERMNVPLGLEPLDAAAFAQLPVCERVSTYVALARLADLKLEFGAAMRQHDLDRANQHLEAMRLAVLALPEGSERTAEERELSHLEKHAAHREYQFASRASEKFARDRMSGASDEKRLVMYQAERALMASKAALAGGAPPARPGPAARSRLLAARLLRRPDGGATNVSVLLGDVTDLRVDVLVNSTNRQLFGNAGVDGAVHRRGGKELTLAARDLKGLDYGEAAFTPGFALPASWVVHTVAAPWQGGNAGELDVLARALKSAFEIASQLGARTLAVPAIGTGTYQTPRDLAALVAMQALLEAIERGAAFDEVSFALIDAQTADAYVQALQALSAGPSGPVN